MRPDQLRLWRGINTAVMFFAMLIPWYYSGPGIEGEIPPNSSTFSLLHSEWMLFIVITIRSGFVRISHGIIDRITIEYILRGVDALLLLLYVTYSFLVLLKKKKEHKSRIVIPAILVILIFAFSSFLGGRIEPMLGFWLISISLLSSAVLEWVNARQVNTIEDSTGK